jgi:YD repeat-containing protein
VSPSNPERFSSTVDYGYDDNGRLTSVTHSGGGSASYTYDDDGRLLTESLSEALRV